MLRQQQAHWSVPRETVNARKEVRMSESEEEKGWEQKNREAAEQEKENERKAKEANEKNG